MSAADHADEHEEEELHQAGWVYFVTYGTCLAFLAMLMMITPRVDSFLPGAAILWFMLMSIPVQIYLAERRWLHFAGSLGVAGAGYFALPFAIDGIGWTVGLFGSLLAMLV